ncbi:hypothetical protein [Bradyrhizobium sp. MOS002]|uniref:hypothetical protein n=1 Tax=Bradyrhizobium sp. MOS002 TaxID=2133947 RepID=UPI001FE1AAD3|nr:hypothetical protein [Bradyrhizobium sp. MOS002]
MNSDVRIVDRDVLPDLLQDLAEADNFAGPLHEQYQYVEGPAAKLDLIVSLKQEPSARYQGIRPEFEVFGFYGSQLQYSPQHILAPLCGGTHEFI